MTNYISTTLIDKITHIVKRRWLYFCFLPAPLCDESSILCHMKLSPNIQLLLKLTKTYQLLVKNTETILLLVVGISAPLCDESSYITGCFYKNHFFLGCISSLYILATITMMVIPLVWAFFRVHFMLMSEAKDKLGSK